MKRILFLFCCLMMLYTLAACKKEDAVMIEDKEQKESVAASEEADKAAVSEEQKEDEQAERANVAVSEENAAKDTGASEEAGRETVVEGDYYIEETFTSTALASAKDGSSPTKELKIYLPPSYYSAGKRYPVVYFFHGFGDSMSFIIARRFLFHQFMTQSGNKEFIVVEVDGSRANTYQGSFWMNSPVTGMWEDYVMDEIIPYIDKTYHTIAKAESRGIAGYSMGGYASLNLSLRHPDVFSSVLALCPGVLKEGSMQIAMDSWRGDTIFLTCYGQTFAPNEAKETMCDIPTMDGTPEDNEIIQKWESGFSDWDDKLEAYLVKKLPLKAIHVINGTMDYYQWIPEGCADLSELMTAKGIDHTLSNLNIGHTFPSGYEEDYFVPFFSENLEFEE